MKKLAQYEMVEVHVELFGINKLSQIKCIDMRDSKGEQQDRTLFLPALLKKC